MAKSYDYYCNKYVWFKDYIRTTDDSNMIWHHFWKDFFFQHRVRYMVYFRICQSTKNRVVKLFCEYKLFKMCRKYGIEVKTNTEIGPGFVMGHPYNITISPLAKIGSNVNVNKGCTIGLSGGKHRGVPVLGNNVYVGINATIVGGITIGNDVVIAPNSFVNQDVPDHSVVIGNPAKIIFKMDAASEYVIYRV